MVFGRQIIEAQVCLLRFVPAGSRILIAGGGTGWILAKLADVHDQGLEIDYIEASARMIALSRNTDCKRNTVNFINDPVEIYVSQNKYDIIITPFFFDNFREDKIAAVFARLNGYLRDEGLWLYADFRYETGQGSSKVPGITSPVWHKVLLKVMYLFFRLTCSIEASELVSLDPYFAEHYEVEFEARFYSGFIKSLVYRKTTGNKNINGR